MKIHTDFNVRDETLVDIDGRKHCIEIWLFDRFIIDLQFWNQEWERAGIDLFVYDEDRDNRDPRIEGRLEVAQNGGVKAELFTARVYE